MNRLWSTFKTDTSPMFKWVAGFAFLILLALAIYGMRGVWLEGQLADLKEKEKVLERQLSETFGELNVSKASAREYKAKADAVVTAIEESKANAKQIELQYEKAVENYEKKKSELGDCGDDPDACQRLLCEELRAAGFKCSNPPAVP